MQDLVISEDDRRLINAMQVLPRANWTLLGSMLNADPVTLSRRWKRLEERGLAWIGVYLAGGSIQSTALLELRCPPSETTHIAQLIAHDPQVLTVDLTTGGRDLLITLTCERQEDLERYVLDRMSDLPQVSSMRTQIITSNRLIFDARTWRLNALSDTEKNRLETHRADEHERISRQRQYRLRDGESTLIFSVLQSNPRISVKDLASRTDLPVQRAGALLDMLLDRGDIVLRPEIARPYSGTPLYAWLFLTVKPSEVASTVIRLARMRETRMTASIIGNYDIALAVWLKNLEDLQRLETALTSQLGVTVADTSIVLRTSTHLHVQLDEHGLRA